jgi:hypothetical protein
MVSAYHWKFSSTVSGIAILLMLTFSTSIFAQIATPIAEAAPEPDEIDERIPYVINIKGLEKTDVAAKFKAVSLLQAGQRDKADSRGRLNRRLAEDSITLTKLLRAEGYYSADFETRVAPAPGPKGSVVVLLNVTRGPRFKFGNITLRNFEDPGAIERLRNIGLDTGEPARAQAIIDGETELRVALPRAGYPFFDIKGRDVEVDYATNAVNVAFDVNSGAKAKFGTIIFDTNEFVVDKHLARLARFKPGTNFNARDVDDFREALLATSLFGSLTVKPVPDSSDPTIANIEVSGTPAKFRTIAVSGGYGTSEGPKIEASWQHRNFLGALAIATKPCAPMCKSQISSSEIKIWSAALLQRVTIPMPSSLPALKLAAELSGKVSACGKSAGFMLYLLRHKSPVCAKQTPLHVRSMSSHCLQIFATMAPVIYLIQNLVFAPVPLLFPNYPSPMAQMAIL